MALVDHDDVLRPHALHAVVAALQGDDDADLVYSDEDKILIGGQRGQVHFKGEFDPDYLLSTNYISHLSVLRRDLVTAVGGFRAGFDGSQDHDLVLRVSERARSVRHVPDVLYSWRQVPGSAALEHSEKPAASDAGRRAVADALARRVPGRGRSPDPKPASTTLATRSDQACGSPRWSGRRSDGNRHRPRFASARTGIAAAAVDRDQSRSSARVCRMPGPSSCCWSRTQPDAGRQRGRRRRRL